MQAKEKHILDRLLFLEIYIVENVKVKGFPLLLLLHILFSQTQHEMCLAHGFRKPTLNCSAV